MAIERAQHLGAVGGLADHLDTTRAKEHQPDPGADQRIVVDQQHADHGGHGSVAVNRKPPPAAAPCSSVPPASDKRSASPIRPVPAPTCSPERLPPPLMTWTRISSPGAPASE